MVRATICCLALPTLGLHAFVPLVPPRPVVRGPAVAPPVAVVDQAAQRPAAPGAYLQPFRPFPAPPQGSRISPDLAMRLPAVPLAAPPVLPTALYVYRYMMAGGMCVIAAFLFRRLLAQRSSSARLRAWARTLKEKVKSLVYTTFAVAATVLMLSGGPALALSTSEAPPVAQAAVQRVLPAAKKFPRTLTAFMQRPQAQQQKMLKYSAKNYIFSDSLTSMSRLEREFDDIFWYTLANRRQHRTQTLVNLGEGALTVAAARAGLLAWERWNKEKERKDIEEEIEQTGRYISPDASDITESVNATTGKKSKLVSNTKAAIPGSFVLHYEIPSGNATLANDLLKKVEEADFANFLLEKLSYQLQDLTNVDRAWMQDKDGNSNFAGTLFPKIPAVQAPRLEGGAITGRVFFAEFGSPDPTGKEKLDVSATTSVLKGFSNLGSRSQIVDTFRAPLALALGVETEQVQITNIVANRDPLYGAGSKLEDGAVRGFLSKTAPSVLRWVESQSAATDDEFWDRAMTQSIYKDTGPPKKEGKDGKKKEK